MAHTKASGVTKGNRDSVAKRLGIKVFGGEKVKAGSILVRQRGTKFNPSIGTKLGADDTVYAKTSGIVKFIQKLGKKYITVS